jgi:urease accessory protein
MRGLQGHLRLVCARDERGRSHLRSQSFRAPMHISKPHEEEGTLVVNVVNPTAGLLAGDEIECEVSVEAGARLLLTTPSAARAHQMRGGCAHVSQHFEIAADAFLDVWPELFIPQAGARYRQRTTVKIEPGGEVLLAEMLAPGRVASGEAFLYDSLRWETDIVHAGELIARERYTLRPGTPSVEALRDVFPAAYYGSVYVISPKLSADAPCWAAIHDLHHAACWVGISSLRRSGFVVKVVAANSITLRREMSSIRRSIYGGLGRPEPNFRRAG